jgi:hypothetical protein
MAVADQRGDVLGRLLNGRQDARFIARFNRRPRLGTPGNSAILDKLRYCRIVQYLDFPCFIEAA